MSKLPTTTQAITATKATEPTALFSPEKVETKTAVVETAIAQAPQKTIYDVFEKLKVYNAKKSFYDEFTEKLDNVKMFRNKHDGSGLVLTIKNQSTGQTVDFSNQNLIVSFLDEAIHQGERIKDKCEVEILNLAI